MTDVIRPYTPSDLAACLSIFDGNTPEFFSPCEREEFEVFLTTHAVAWNFQVIERDGKLVACGGHALDLRTGCANFCWGMVEQGLHGTGLGTMLTVARLTAIRDTAGVVSVCLDTSQHTQGFYAHFGFRHARTVVDGYGPGLDRWEMVLDLHANVTPATALQRHLRR
ncbi:hypothetical protein ASF61_07280 [Duganella sp. Leaf126]|nr:hypothetical protein ASF61_07280 [Duganella sp. Leaf126]